MKQCAVGIAAILIVSCGQSELNDYEIVASSAVTVHVPGATPPAECEFLGEVLLEPRDVSITDSVSGFAFEDLSRALSSQLDKLGANTLVPNVGSDLIASAESGAAYEAKAYRCP